MLSQCRAVADQVEGNEEAHGKYQHLAVDYIQVFCKIFDLCTSRISILRVQMHALFTCKLQCPLVYLLLYCEASAWHCQAQVVLIYMQATKKFYIIMFPELMVCVQRCCDDKVTACQFQNYLISIFVLGCCHWYLDSEL